MATDALIGYGTTFERSDGASPEVWTAIAEVMNITPPSFTRETQDATHMASPNAYREFISGLRDAGEVSLEINYIPGASAQTTLLADLDSDLVVSYRIVFPVSPLSTVTFTAFVTAFSPEAPLDAKLTASVTFKVTGLPVWS